MAGLAKDDVIVKLDGADVTDADAFAAAVRAAPQGAVLKLLIQREGNSVVFAAMAKP
jgi:S1-C subfamily serine protease